VKPGRTLALLALTLSVAGAVASQPRPASRPDAPAAARKILDETIAKSKAEHKVVFMAFHASWCGWCHKLEDFLNDPKIKPIVAKHINVLWLDCMEQGDKKSLENPGVDAIMAKYDATQTGLPTMFIIDGNGKTIASSIKEKTGNIGYPGEPDEIVHFEGMLKKAGFTASDLSTIDAELKVRAAALKAPAAHR
jgi:thioredoxin-related protein